MLKIKVESTQNTLHCDVKLYDAPLDTFIAVRRVCVELTAAICNIHTWHIIIRHCNSTRFISTAACEGFLADRLSFVVLLCCHCM